MAGDVRSRNVYDKKSQRYANSNKQHLIVRSDKSVAYVINNKRLGSTFFTRHEVSRGLFATAELLIWLKVLADCLSSDEDELQPQRLYQVRNYL